MKIIINQIRYNNQKNRKIFQLKQDNSLNNIRHRNHNSNSFNQKVIKRVYNNRKNNNKKKK